MRLNESVKKAEGRKIQRHIEHLEKNGISDTIDRMSKAETLELWEWAVKVNDRYAELLSGTHRDVRDVNQLPFSKDKIKLALKLLLLTQAAVGKKEMVQILMDRYVNLAIFQAIPEEALQQMAMDAENHTDKSNRFTTHDAHNALVETVVAEKKQLLVEIENSFRRLEAVKSQMQTQQKTAGD
jgi:hypothetical protein